MDKSRGLILDEEDEEDEDPYVYDEEIPRTEAEVHRATGQLLQLALSPAAAAAAASGPGCCQSCQSPIFVQLSSPSSSSPAPASNAACNATQKYKNLELNCCHVACCCFYSLLISLLLFAVQNETSAISNRQRRRFIILFDR